MAKKKIKKKPVKKKQLKRRLMMDFMSMKNVEGRNVDEKIKNILKNVKGGHIVVLDEALNFDEETRLLTATMEGIGEDFSGIEFCSMPKKSGVLYRVVMRFVKTIAGRKVSTPGLTLVGPSAVIEEIKRDPEAFYVSAKI